MLMAKITGRHQWRFALGLMVMVVAVGVLGYMLLAGMSFIDSLYQTLITITTVGFKDQADETTHSPGVKLFTLFLLIFGISVVAFAFSIFTRDLIEGELRTLIGHHGARRRVRFMKNHYIVCGCGRMGEIIADALKRDNIPTVVIDTNPERRSDLADKDIPCIIGDATLDEVLHEAAIDKARGLIAVTGSDPENLFITMSARQLNPDLIIVCRALTKEVERKMLRAGANRVILPYKLGAHQIAQAALRPNVVDFIEIASRTSNLDIALEEMQVAAASELVGKQLRDATVLRNLGLIVIGVRPAGAAGESMLFNPSASTVIGAGDTLIALGKPDNLEQVRRHLS
jgi:voltage-gated potassium channel